MRKLITSLCMLMLCCALTYAQTRTVTGKVTDAQGKPVPYATVTVKGTGTAVSADENGNFSIEAAPNSVLVFSASGYQGSEVNIKNQTSVTALVSGQNNMSEVVVTALGIRRSRNSLPYSTQSVTGDEIIKTQNSNFVENLSGKVAGLQITSSNTLGGSTNVILRGLKSLTQSNQALFVVDGVPYDNTNQSRTVTGNIVTSGTGFDLGNSASDINPEDIESVSVLKGAAASALYGSRASNGVVLITTKKGKKNSGIGVTANFGITVGSVDKSTMPVYQTEYGQGYGSSGYNPAIPSQNGFFYYQPIFNSNGQRVSIVHTDEDAGTGPAYDPSLMVYNWDAFSPGNPNYGKATPWMPAAHYDPIYFLQTPVNQTASVFAQGGGENGTFKLGLSHSDDKGLLPNSDLLKNMVNLNVTHSLTDKVTLGGELNYAHIAGLGRYGFGYTGTSADPFTDFRQWWPTNVDIYAQKADFFRTGQNATWNWLTSAYSVDQTLTSTLKKPAYHNNWYYTRYVDYENDSRDRYFGNVNFNYKIAPFLNLMGRMSIDNWNELMETRFDKGSVETSSYNRFNSSFKETNYDLLLNFDKNISSNLNLKALLGGNIRQVNNQNVRAITNGGLIVPGFFSLSNSVNPNLPTEYYSDKEVDGLFTGATLSYKEMLTLDATLRRDKSSTLPLAHNSYYYPAVSGNFVFSKLMPSAEWLSYGKLRANYAEVGGDAPVYSVFNTYTSVAPISKLPISAFNGQPMFSLTNYYNNPNLLPESNKTYELGAELSFLKNRIGLDVTYYNAKQINQIMPIYGSNASGYTFFFVNGGTVQNKGWEVSLNLTPVKSKNFMWNANINWSKNQNTVLSLYNNQSSFVMQSLQNSIQIVAEVGKSEGIIRGTDYKYLNGQKLVDANGYYELSSNALSDIGNVNPEWLAGINNSFKYKNLTLSFLIDVRKGGDVYSLDMDYGSSSGLYPETAGKNDLGKSVRAPLGQGGGIILPGVTADGKPNTTRIDESDINAGFYTFSSSYGMADKSYVYDASYVKLRELAISYALPKGVISSLKVIKGLEFSLTGRNLWIIHKNLPYSDPEQGISSGNASMGFQSGAYPTVRTFGFNIRAKF